MRIKRNKTTGDTQNSPEDSSSTGAPSPQPQKLKSSGRKHFTLLIGDEGAILVFSEGTTVLRRLFAASAQPDHTSIMTELMRANPKTPVSILVDVLDQQYVRHTFPPVSPMGIEGLVKRRMDRDFNPEDIKAGLRLGRDTAGRKEWQYLIISLTATPLIQQWLEVILELPNPMLGIYLLPVEMQTLVPALSKATGSGKKLPWQLIISNNKVSGFRQAVLREGKLVFTRVSQASDDAIPAVIAGNIEQEIINTLEYIRRLDFAENESLEIFAIAAQEVVDALDLHRFAAGNAIAFTPMEIANVLGLQQAALSADRFGDVVIATTFAATRKPVLRLANGYIDKLAGLYKLRFGGTVAAAIIAGLLLLSTASDIVSIIGSYSATAEAEDKLRKVHADLAVAQKAVGALNKDTAYQLLVMSAYDSFIKDVPQPQDFVNELAPLLTPEIRVKHLQWGPPASAAAAASPPPGGSTNLEIRADMEISGTYKDAAKATKAADHFFANLKASMPRYDITVQPYPWADEKNAPQQIQLDQALQSAGNELQSDPLASGRNIVSVTFVGPKKVAGGQAKLPGETP